MAAFWDVLIIGGGHNGLVEHLARRAEPATPSLPTLCARRGQRHYRA